MADDKAKWDNLTKRARDFVKLLSSGDVAKASEQLNTTMQQAMPGDGLKQLWLGLENQVGPYAKQELQVRTSFEDGFDCVYLESKFEKAMLWVKVVFEKSDKVAGIQFVPNAP